MKTAIVCILLAFGLAGCGGTTVHPKSAPLNAPDYHFEFVPYQGHTLTCIIKLSGRGNYSWGGPSCDYAQFHHRYGYRR